MVGRTLLHYTLLAELGEGAMGRVYLARDTRTDRRVAIKLLSADAAGDPERRARLAREAQVAARLSHPGIVTLHALEEADGELFLVEEFIDGETLARRLERGPLGPSETIRLGRELATALDHAHAQGVLHRDLKPENVLVAADGSYKVADFGIARVEGAPTLTAEGALVGTVPYMAPERIRGHRGDARSDLFSLGAILYEALAGRRAFSGSEVEAMHAILNEDPPPLGGSGARAALESLIRRLLAKEPTARPANTQSVLGTLEGIGASRPESRPRWPVTVVALAAAGAIALVGLVWMFQHRPSTPTGEPAVAVLYFENVADPIDEHRLGPITGNLLVTSLAQSPGLNVLGTERVLDAMRQLGERRRPPDRSMALEIARRVRAGRIVAGSILQVSPALVMTAELVEVPSGKVLGAYRVEGEPGQNVFQVVDLLSRRLASRLASPNEAMRLAPVAERSSSDLEAVRSYLQGLEHLSHGELAEAREALTAAVDRDSNFAQAQYQLGIVRWWQGEPQDAASAIHSGALHEDRLSPHERVVFSGVQALVANDWTGARAIFEPLTRQDPGDKLSAYGLLEARFHGGDLAGAVDVARRTLTADSTFTLASVHLVDAAVGMGRYAFADSVARVGLRISPGNGPLWTSFTMSQLARGDAREFFRVVDASIAASRRSPTVLGVAFSVAVALDSLTKARPYLARLDSLPLPPPIRADIHRGVRYAFALRAGRFREAEAIAAQSWQAWKVLPHVPSLGPGIPSADGLGAARGTGDMKQGRIWVDSMAARMLRWSPRDLATVRGVMLFRLGLVDEARRELARLDAEGGNEGDAAHVRYLRGLIRGADGKTDEALALLASGSLAAPPWRVPSAMRLVRVQLLMAAGRNAEALTVLDTLLALPTVGMADVVRLHYYRGQVLQRLGRVDDARASYAKFLAFWKDADPGTPEVAEARAALARLEHK